jgi:two-component system response regulator AtoC
MNLNGRPHVLVVDDDQSLCAFLASFLSERGHRAIPVSNARDAVRHYSIERPAAVILDLVMPGDMDGLDALAAFRKIDSDVPIIVLSGQGRTATVVQAMKLGARDFVSKPFEESDLEAPLALALRHHQLNREIASLRDQLQTQSTHTMLFGHSERMAEVRDEIARVAATAVTVLIRGESGTGKELVARAFSASSLRGDKPFVKVNCATLPAERLESELFGCERGASSGAIQRKPGKFEFANHGTMFMEDIGDLSLPLQAKLLQALQSGGFSRLGGSHDVRVDVRVIAATSKDLELAVAAGRFHEDLFLHLNAVCIHVPPLRERREEVPILVDYFLKKYCVQDNKPWVDLSRETIRLLVDYDWPGNVRELEHVIQRAVALGTEAPIRTDIAHRMAMAAQRVTASGLRGTRPGAPSGPLTPAAIACAAAEAGYYSLKDISRTAAREAERELIVKMLQQTRWNRKETAEILGISYKALLYKIKQNGLDKAS